MIRLGLRLTFNGGKEALARLIVTAAAVALGVGLLLIALSGVNALGAQNGRTAWLNTSMPDFRPGPDPSRGPAAGAGSASPDPLWFQLATDHFGSATIDRVDVAATGPSSPVPPGLARLPGPGQFYLSPALAKLIRSTPVDQLGNRFPGTPIGTIGPAGLPSPKSLIIVMGHAPADLTDLPHAAHITSINADPIRGGPTGWDNNKLQTILAVGALALLFPVLIFIATATRLSAARREQRFAAMRLVGALPRQVSIISAVESSVAAIAGVVIGFAVFFALRPVLTSVPFTGEPFAPGDLSLSTVDILLVVFGVPAAAALAARIAMRRVVISPLGVTRRVTPPVPRAWRLLPLVAGIVELAYFVKIGPPKATGSQITAYFSGCFLMMAGLVVAGPWLTMLGARLLARRTGRPAVLISGRRLADDPRGAFRSISGLIIALFVTSVSVGVITTMLDYQSTSSGATAHATLLQQIGGPGGPRLAVPAPGQHVNAVTSVPAGQLAALRSMPGIEGASVVYADPDVDPTDFRGPQTVLVACDQLARTPAIGKCPPGAQVARVRNDLAVDGIATTTGTSLEDTVWPAASIAPSELPGLPVDGIVLESNGSRSVVERARTALAVDWPTHDHASTLSEINEQSRRLIVELQQLTDIVIVVSLVVAGCSLAVSVTSGVSDRRRPFSLLRLAGAPLSVLRRVVALEAAVPLCAISVVSACAGLVAAGLFLRSQLGESLRPPGPGYYLIVVAGLATSLGIIASTLPLIERITGPENARNE
ncbi:MAG: ABC transporter permease [Actinomycetota bacterium]|nr:ABC transporter permease [Actinomycetota bacterium]